MALEKKIFAGGGMDMDTDERFMDKADYKKAVNCRITKSDEGNDGIVENIRANMKHTNPNIDDGDVVIGAYEDKSTQSVIYFVHAADGDHGIYRRPPVGNIQTIIQDPILNFSRHHIITGINVVGSDEDKFPEGLLYWTDDFNPPRKININKALTNGYSMPITEQMLDVIKWPPTISPFIRNVTDPYSSSFLTDTYIKSNQLKEKSWQFKYRWIYDDGEKSAWSPVSKVISDDSFSAAFNFEGNASYDNNVLAIGFLSGSDPVVRIQIAARNTNGTDDFFLVADIDKSNVKERVGGSGNSIPTTFSTTLTNTTSAYDWFYFYNDAVYSTIDTVESNKLYNDVPHKAKAQEIVDGNILVYGNVESGQTGLDTMDINLSAKHPTETIVESAPQVITMLEEEHMAKFVFTDDNGSAGSNKWYTTSTFYIRWKIPEPINSTCTMQYNLNVNGLKASKFCFRNVYISRAHSDSDVITLDMNHTTNTFVNPTSASAIATDIAIYAASQTSDWTITEFKANNPGDPYYYHAGLGGNINEGSVGSDVKSVTWSSDNEYVKLKIKMSEGNQEFPIKTYHDWTDICGIRVPKDTWPNNKTTQTSWSTGTTTKGGYANTKGTCTADAKVAWRVGIGYSNDTSSGSQIRSSAFSSNQQHIYVSLIYTFFNITTNAYKYTSSVSTRAAQYVSDGSALLNQNNSQFTSACNLATNPLPLRAGSFKTGAKHKFGLVYYDDGGRSSSVQIASINDVYIPKASEQIDSYVDGAGNTKDKYTGEWEIEWEINHAPPSWATMYQWVYSGNTLTNKFLQFVTGGFYAGDHFVKKEEIPNLDPSTNRYTGNILVDITNIRKYNEQSGGDVVSYQFQEGDILRFVNDGTIGTAPIPSPQDFEFKIVGVVGERGNPPYDPDDANWSGSTQPVIGGKENREYLILANEVALTAGTTVFIDFTTASVPAFENYTMEIYSPLKSEDDTIIYHEFGEVGNCNVFSGELRHDRILGDLTSAGQDITTSTPAVGTFKKGDVYYRLRNSQSMKVLTPVESFHYSDVFKSDYWDKGRPNAVLEDFKRTRKHSTCLYSESYIPNTNINGLSSFFPDVSFTEFERDYNSIQKLHSRDNKLIIFQEDKVSQSLVNRNIIYNVDGSGNVATSDSVLSQAVPYLGNYGINRNPESFASYGNRMYFVDMKRGVVLRLSNDGFTPISEYKMKNFFTDSFENILNHRGTHGHHRLLGVYDTKFNEYVVSSEGVWTEKLVQDKDGNWVMVNDKVIENPYTVGFCESANKWNSFYSYLPEMMCTNGTGFVSFNEGDIYRHNISGAYKDAQQNIKYYNLYNKFYGVDYDSELWVVSNEAASNNKIYKAFSEESDDVWEVDFESPNRQETQLLSSNFDTKENIHYSDIMNDINSPGGIIEGDRIRDVSLLAKMKMFSSKLSRVFAVNFNFSPSHRSNK